MSVTKQRLIKIIAKGNSSENSILEDHAQINEHHEYITGDDESAAITTDDYDGGDYEIAGNSDDTDGGSQKIHQSQQSSYGDDYEIAFVEYVTEDDDITAATATVSGDSNDSEHDVIEYDDDDDGDGGGGTDELYNCSSCGMNFKSVTEHIEKHHPEQDVLIDISDEGGATTIKTERTLYLNDDDDDDGDNDELGLDDDDDDGGGGGAGGSDAVGMVDGELVVYGGGADDELIDDDDDELIDDVFDENDDSVVYTYDNSTGQITRATAANSNRITNKIGSTNKSSTVTVQKPVKRSTRSIRKLEMTKNLNDPLSDHVCAICNTSFYSAKSLKLHARMHLPVKSKTLDEACDMEMTTGDGDEQDPSREKFYCSICGKHYDRSFEQVHVRMHSGEEKFNCRICNKVFPNDESLKMHMNAHQDARVIRTKAEMKNIKLPYGCRFCGKEFARPHEKVKHERVHTGEKPYECELCGKCFRVSYCLTIHMRTHTDARPYVCPKCQKRFKAQSVYNHHLLTHSDERNYKCPYCPKTFKTSVQLSGHKNSHTKPFTCTECNRPFGSLYAVRAHMDSHKRPNHNLKHICEICGAKYARRFALNDHMKEQHKDVHFVIVDTSNAKKAPAKRPKKLKQLKILDDEDERELEAAGQSILSNMVEQEITISEIENFDNEEEVVEMDDWLK